MLSDTRGSVRRKPTAVKWSHLGLRSIAGRLARPRWAAGAVVVLALVISSSPAAADQDAFELTADHLIRSQLSSGLLRYDFDFVGGAPSTDDDIVRQAGVVAFMAAYFADTRDPRMRVTVEKSLLTFRALSAPISNGWWQPLVESSGLPSIPIGRRTMWQALERVGLLYRPHGDGRVLTLDGKYASAYTGATAMALLAELLYFEASGDDRYSADRAAWLKGLLAAHNAGRGFRSTPTNLEESPFSNGEAWLALSHYHRRYPHDDAVARLVRGLDSYLMRRYDDDVATGFYQWGTMAAAVRFQTTLDRRFLDFIARQAARALDEAPWSETRHRNTCAMVEGLATAAPLLSSQPEYSVIARRLTEKVDQEMTKNQRFQIPPNVSRLELGDGIYLVSRQLGDFSGAFLAGASRVYTRIDYTGHCLAAMLKRMNPRTEAQSASRARR
jgi:hypothetical protein